MDIKNRLLKFIAEEDLQEDEPLKSYTTFRAGGAARYFISPATNEQLSLALELCRENGLNWMVLGRGSNLLVSDSGFDGVVISLRRHFSSIFVDEKNKIITAGAGASMPALANTALQAGFGGLEFASGIPGTVGGGVLMNAGAYGGEFSQVVLDVTVMEESGEIKTISNDEAAFSYRNSLFLHKNWIVLSCRFQLIPDDKEKIKARMDDYNGRRKEKQPLEYPSAGSTFKRPVGYFAGKLIEDCGLKGFQVGDAQVSEKHAGFVINRGNASASDIYELCKKVKERVLEQTGVQLELEVRLIGKF